MERTGLKPIDELVRRAIIGDGTAFTKLWDTYVDALGHLYGDWIIEKDPTPMAEGSRYRACTRCGNRETQAIPRADLNEQYGMVNFTIKS